MDRRRNGSGLRRWLRRAALPAGLALAVALAPAANAGLLSSVTGTVVGVVSTLADTTAGLLTGADWGYSPEATSMSEVRQDIGASTLALQGVNGKGVGVALLDTGVVPVTGLTSGNVVNGPDLSFDGSVNAARYYDSYGHGTHMAGIIAGNDGSSGGFLGVAPAATLVNVRVGASSGAVDVSQVIAGIDWVVQHRNDPGLNIRVINLSFGTDGTQDYRLDPLAAAVEHAWRAGIVVVVSGGNAGATQPSLDEPAYDPYVIAVGADDTNGTQTTLDDTVPAFSSRGSSARHVDVLAPGQSIVSLRDPGSYVDTEYPSAVVNTRFFKGSGTSQAAAVVSGAVALLLQQRPQLTPDDVKRLLIATAHPLAQADTASQGAGLIDAFAASLAPRPYAVQNWALSSGTGSLEAARGTHHVTDNGVELTGEKDIFGAAWNPAAWAPASAKGTAWNGGTWNGNAWAGGCWCGTSWTARTWAAGPWSGADWAGVSWSAHLWSSESWSAHLWTGSGWSAHCWSDHSWSGAFWS